MNGAVTVKSRAGNRRGGGEWKKFRSLIQKPYLKVRVSSK